MMFVAAISRIVVWSSVTGRIKDRPNVDPAGRK
jgi:hypothetical protein